MYGEIDKEHSILSSWVYYMGYLTYTESLCRDLSAFGLRLSTILRGYGLACRPRNSQTIEISRHGVVATIYYALGKGYLYSIRRSYYVEPLRLPILEALLEQVLITFQCVGCYYSTKAGIHNYCGKGMPMGAGSICTGYQEPAPLLTHSHV
jgi:hypothetical protein